ncbi:hypothetical protein C8F01DRAFT_1123226 [Mycena amicta]|nr:hypothetical protein C8F01DRAFT_1123226 [Mycena amicta]
MLVASGFLSLPNELLLDVFSHFEDPYPLYPLSTLCRRLHFLALPLYLTRTGVYETLPDPASCNISVGAEQTGTLAALQTSLFLGAAKNLSCTFCTPTSRFQDIARFYRLCSILTSAQSTILFFSVGTFDNYSDSILWRYAFDVVRALNMLLEKSCGDLTVATFAGASSTFRGRVSRRHIVNTPGPSTAAVTSSASLSPAALRRKSLSKFQLHSEVLFYPHLRAWTIDVLNSFPLTSLSIVMPNVQADVLGAVLSDTEIPTLRDLTIRECRLKPSHLHLFLARHPHITHLHLEKLVVPSLQERLPRNALQSLEVLAAEPTQVAYLLHALDGLPTNLQSIRLLSHMTTVDLQATNTSLRHVASRLAQGPSITLVLPVPDNLPRVAPDTGLCFDDTDSALHFVSRLELLFRECTTPIPLPKLTDYVAKWSAPFPLLRVVELAELRKNDRYEVADIVEAVKPSLLHARTLLLNGREIP